jgi:hypothetical protein
MSYIPDSLRQLVRQRAQGRCEYCLFPEAYSLRPHEIDHIIPEKHGGPTVETNLCLCCGFCNRYKGSDLAAVDPETDEVVTLFHPRRDAWNDHFQLDGAEIKAITPKGRVMIRLLRLNNPDRVDNRALLIAMNQYP